MSDNRKVGRNNTAPLQDFFGAAFDNYDPDVFDLIALHFWNDSRRAANGSLVHLGKAPINRCWSTMPADSRRTRERCVLERRNMGIRIRSDQLVIDVDPRNYLNRSDSFLRLCSKLCLNADDWPRVLTGSGGIHCYLALPEGVRVRETLKVFPGVEFKTKGRQVVAAGSRHPNGKYYRWSTRFPSIRAGLPMVPAALLEVIQRPVDLGRDIPNAGVYDSDQLEQMLKALDVEQFRHHEDWLKLMFASHHATAGEGEEVFIRWSTSDPLYDDHDELIRARWQSCSQNKRDVITHRTLHAILRKHGAGHSIPISENEFPDISQVRNLGKLKQPRVIGKVRS